METLYIENKKCPFCNNRLRESFADCNMYLLLPCLICQKCNAYLFTESNYNVFQHFDNYRKHKVYKYQIIENKPIKKQKPPTPKPKNQKKKNLKRTRKTIEKFPIERISTPKQRININLVKKCSYYKNKSCLYFDDLCNPYSIKCANRGILSSINKSNPKAETVKTEENKLQANISLQQHQYAKAIILSYNRKCIYEEHTLTNVKVLIRVLAPNNKIIDVEVLAAYCKECDQYIILKNDFKTVKQNGILLCQVIDKTPEYIIKHKNHSYSGTESRVHSLGYNVIKQRYNYTFEQRKIILANILENYGVSKHEILSMIDVNIARKIKLPNYSDAIEKWKQDREFVSNYKIGDCPKVIIDKVSIGRG